MNDGMRSLWPYLLNVLRYWLELGALIATISIVAVTMQDPYREVIANALAIIWGGSIALRAVRRTTQLLRGRR